MIVRAYIFIFFFLGCSYGHAQEILISKDIDLRSSLMYDVLGKYDDEFVLYHDHGVNIYIDIFDKDLNHIVQWDMLPTIRKPKIIGVDIANGINIAYQSKIERQKYIRIDKFDARGIRQDSLMIEHNLSTLKQFRYATSEDESISCIFKILNGNSLVLWVIDNTSLELLWSKNISVETNFKSNFEGLIVSNSGDVVTVSSESSTLFSQYTDRIYNFLVLNKDRTRTSKLVLEYDYVSDIIFDFYPKNDKLLYINGFYSIQHRSEAMGLVYSDINISNLEDTYYFKNVSFEAKFLDKYYKSSIKRKYIRDLTIRSYIPRADKGYIIVGEIVAKIERATSALRYTQGISGRRWTDFYNKDIIILSYNADNTLHWSKILHKNQYAQDEEHFYTSFFLLKNQKQLKFIYNDDVASNSTVNEYSIDPLGNSNRHTVFNSIGRDIRLRIRDGIQISFDEVLIPSQLNRTLNLVKLKF